MKYKLSDLIDIPKLQHLIDIFHAATRITSTVLDGDGTILARSGWSDLCTNFHRANPETEARCRESDSYVRLHLGEGKGIVAYPCANGLTNVAAPIVIDGEYAGAVIVGQFLSEEPDEERFRKQARGIGFEERAYLKALKEVPVVPQKGGAGTIIYQSGCGRTVGLRVGAGFGSGGPSDPFGPGISGHVHDGLRQDSQTDCRGPISERQYHQHEPGSAPQKDES